MTTDQVALARRRLGLGITNVGFWVLAATSVLGWLAWGRGVSTSRVLPVFALVSIAVQAIFDGVGGWWLMPMPRPSPMEFLRVWFRGVIVHSVVLAAAGTVALLSLRWTGGFCAGVAVSSVLLAVGRRWIHRGVCGGTIRTAALEGGERVLVTEVRDPAFTGGMIGFGRGAGILLPEGWIHRVPRAELAAEIFRRRWQVRQGLPGRAFLLLLMWNLLGVWIGEIVMAWGDLPTGHALVGLACWMTLWTVVSLLILPVLSRGTVQAADRAAADAGLDPSGWIRLFPGITGEDGNPRAALQNIFYPIPSAELRLRALGESRTGVGLGNLARGNLYQSVAGLTLLGRAVHCNVGRPALWVFPPSA